MTMIVWQGPSQLTGDPIVVLATFASGNSKTGAMTQTHIVRSDMSPIDALATGGDTATCFDCPLRSRASGGNGACYVHPIIRRRWGTSVAWQQFADGKAVAFDPAPFTKAPLRIGTYGDPAAVPVEVWRKLIALAGSHGHTAYTHQWRRASDLRAIAMASCDTNQDRHDAIADGWDTYSVHPVGTARPLGTKPCPASAEMGARINCSDCLRCGGTSTGRRGNHVAIEAHGSGRKRIPLAVV